MERRTAVAIAWLRSTLPFCLWCGFACWMLLDWQRDPYDPSLTATRAYGHNAEGSLALGLAASVLELAVFYAVTCPFLTRRPRWFFVLPLIAIVPLAGWFVVCALLSMHAGGITMIHLIWLMALGVALLVESILSGVTGLAPPPRRGP